MFPGNMPGSIVFMFVWSECSVDSHRIVLSDILRVFDIAPADIWTIPESRFFVVSAEMFIFGPRLKSLYADQ